jgi:formate C-acetyltransferase
MHHYGNDDDYADDLAKFVIGTYCKYVEHRPTPHGGEYMPGVFSVTANVMTAPLRCHAGRPARLRAPVRLLGSRPYEGRLHDRKGPTAVADSVAKLDHARSQRHHSSTGSFSPAPFPASPGATT